MIRRSDVTVSDAQGTPEGGIYITVKDDTGALATLYNDAGTLMANPFQSTAVTGVFTYNIADGDAGTFTEEYRLTLGGTPRTIESIDLSVNSVAVRFASTRTAMALMSTTLPVILTEAGCEGTFVWSSANLQTLVTADTRQGIYVPPTGGNGSTGAWVRQREGNYIHIDWLGPAGDGVTDDYAVFVALRSLAAALATNAGSGLKAGPEVRLGHKTYYIATTFDWKGCSNRWVGDDSGHENFPANGSTIKVANNVSFVVNRANTESGTVGTAISAFGADGSTFEHICFQGSGGGTAPVVKWRAKATSVLCRYIGGGSHGLQIEGTSSGGTTLEGNANGWRVLGGAFSGNAGSGLAVGLVASADVNGGSCFGATFQNNTRYGIEHNGFLGDVFRGCLFEANALGHVLQTNANATCIFDGYFEGGVPVSAISIRSRASGPNSGTSFTGARLNASLGFIDVSPGLRSSIVDGAKTLTMTRGAGGNSVAASPYVDDINYTDFWGGAASVTSYFRAGTGIYVLNAVAYATADINMALNGNAGTRYTHGLSVAPSNALSMRELWLGDGSFPDGRRIVTGSAAPTTGEHAAGERVFNNGSVTSAATVNHWLCTVTGTPGTWIAVSSPTGSNTGDETSATVVTKLAGQAIAPATVNSSGVYQKGGTQVVGARDTGWAADTGTAKKTATATYAPGTTLTFSAGYVQAEATAVSTRLQLIEPALRDATQEIKAIKDALMTHGLLGT